MYCFGLLDSRIAGGKRWKKIYFRWCSNKNFSVLSKQKKIHHLLEKRSINRDRFTLKNIIKTDAIAKNYTTCKKKYRTINITSETSLNWSTEIKFVQNVEKRTISFSKKSAYECIQHSSANFLIILYSTIISYHISNDTKKALVCHISYLSFFFFFFFSPFNVPLCCN